MKLQFSALILIFLISFSNCAQDKHQIEATDKQITTLYFIRHAEKDRSDKANRDPHLTEIGLARANHWNNILKHVNFNAVYSTNYHRTKETALPTANRSKVELTIYDANDLDGKKLKANNLGKTVLIVGHSNTTPQFVNSVIGQEKYQDIDDSNNGNLYVVTIVGETITDQVLEINPR